MDDEDVDRLVFSITHTADGMVQIEETGGDEEDEEDEEDEHILILLTPGQAKLLASALLVEAAHAEKANPLGSFLDEQPETP